ncbi:formate-dependent nitrite reductase, periplasmic cytochrome c552 subunit [Candidatus Methanoperedens nitroreducens]|uniref:Formate-dependent nitrite reductase, periplasmic cytochrome c552 subunit n=1 Tax=Candidatus Methanoperedens nitratireducens TaxID=1392998 RepID=A0A062VD06_9EURY|nr:ammonia-forming cytochrome c nitrite reductase subunit c552 [Candidatus Methanoperedens nitroreducens]KCZ73529.1 formate-dependent nitrite reductase, periplasmic cytochrome c552 subunit [Candidatus Methanoperedens nitroreducens]MDJ1422513.1 cytochrome c3 family protein [Candidatus Methanoperedens sp.]
MQVKSSIILLALTGIVLFLIPQVSASENSCIDCHKTLTPFIEVQKQFNQIRIQHLEKNVACSLQCHEDRVRQLATANYQQWSESVHALKGVTCEVCHGGDPKQATKERAHTGFKNITDPQSPLYYTNVPETCGNCHPKELDNFEGSKHYQKLEALKLAPTCTTCHAPHTFRVLNPEEFRKFCGNCHSVYTKVAPYDIPVRAEYMLEQVNKLKFRIDMANQDIFWAKKNGTDVTEAQGYVDSALKKLGNMAILWHEFNLTHFEDELDSANREVKKAGDIVGPDTTPAKPAPAQAPGFTGLSVMVSLLAVLYIIRKRLRIGRF